tara:strand:- start:3567 stop:4307 length:741 start_codon:yes stop_codon:yes gene_type:complete
MNNTKNNSNLNSFFEKKLKYDKLVNEINKLKKKNKNDEDIKKYKRYTNKLNKIGNNIKFVITDDNYELVDNDGDGNVIDSCTRIKKILLNNRIKNLEDEEQNVKNDLLFLKYNILYEYEDIEDYENYDKYKNIDDYGTIITNMIEDLEKKIENINKIKEKIILQKNSENNKLKKMYDDYKLSKSSIKNELLLVDENNIAEKKEIIKNLFVIEKNIQDVLNNLNSNEIQEINFNKIEDFSSKINEKN